MSGVASVRTLRVAGPLHLCATAPSHYIWLGTLSGNAAGSWVSRSRRSSRASSPTLPGSELGEGGGRGLINQQQLSRVLFQFLYHPHCRWPAPPLPHSHFYLSAARMEALRLRDESSVRCSRCHPGADQWSGWGLLCCSLTSACSVDHFHNPLLLPPWPDFRV